VEFKGTHLTPNRDRDAAEACLRKALRNPGEPKKITIERRGSNAAAIKHYTKAPKMTLLMRRSKPLNNLVDQDHRAVRRTLRPGLGIKSFWSARCPLAGIGGMHAMRKRQRATIGAVSHTPAEQCYALAA
jgi:transposase-like protein